MMNYKKSLLSLAAVLALSNSVIADNTATYLPLTSTTSDSTWVLFGVNGFSDGTPSNLGTVVGAFGAGLTELEDTVTTDELATSGLISADANGNMASLQDIASSTSLKVGVDMTGTIFDATEPVRTMYIKVNSASPNVKFNYRASLEGKGMEILLNSVLYSVTISQDSTWSNAIDATVGGLTAAASATDRVNILDVLDYNATNNPANPIHFDSTKHFNTAATANGSGTAAKTAAMYHFNAITQQWEVWNKNNSTSNANDFTKLSKGQAYWGRVDVDDAVGSLNNDAGGAASLILGEATALSGIPDPDVYADDTNVSTLTTGWNMLSFDDSKPVIRYASTGLVTSGWAAGDDVNITDDSGLNRIDITLVTANDEQAWATQINGAIETAKLLGKLPQTFNVKAFAAELAATNGGALTFISDKKFALEATAVAVIPAITLTGANPYVNGVVTAVADIEAAAAPVTSAHGEYSIMLDLLTQDLYGAPTAATLDSIVGGANSAVSAKILFGDTAGDNTAIALTAALDGDPTATTAKVAVEADPIFDGTDGTGDLNAIDTDSDGVLDKVIVASTIPFYVKDSTFVRVQALDSSAAGGETITVDSTTSASIAVALNDAASVVAGKINAVADDGTTDTNVFAARGSAIANLVTVSTENNLFDIKDVASGTLDFLTSASDSNISTKGAIKGAYSLDNVASLPIIQHEFTTSFTSAEQPDSTGDTLDINVTIGGLHAGVVDFNATATGILDTAAGRLAYFDSIVAEINREIATNPGYHGYATHNFTTATDNFTGTKILVAGMDVTAFTIVENTEAVVNQTRNPSVPADGNSATAGQLGSGISTGDLSADVKTNPVHTPNFAIQGPLYTLRKDSNVTGSPGYDVRAILKATTEMDSNTGALAWDSIDITRDEDDWFANNEFNLFKINHNAGYWVYLDTKSADTVSIGTVTLSSTPYTYHFANDASLSTTNIMNNGQISVTITGLDDASGTGNNNAGTAYAVIGGEEIQLVRTSNTDIFTGTVSNYALASFAEQNTPIAVDVRAVNGKGQAVSSSSVLSIDYTAPTNLAAVDASTTGIALSADGNASNFYIWRTYIPEVETVRSTTGTSAGNLIATVAATNGAATYNDICSDFAFGTNPTLRIVAADGTINNANLSDAVDYVYASTLAGAHVLTHTQGGGTLKSQIGVTYDSSCTATTSQPAVATDNNGVSLATLTSGATSRISFVPDSGGSNFTQDLAWTSNYALTGGGTAIIQVQNTSAYAGNTFYVEYGGNLYTATFPATQAAADASIGTTIALTQVTGAGNTSLVP